ncbi:MULTISPECIES: dTDP-4-dehydrorhamnose reductase [unclassified Gilliamella]|uniref:dTDP-4-dehydrorhamnose reductase n=1 Tax=unclassified Gilliamella TaxID=2685620 RepID=UPI00226ADD2E|nr:MULTISPECIES: dTDP-4-dehydrorhamnose reductase [unclassified Gilliamella]MCX8596155.1 dTDP-4-dehydrorhamnose reductase [Gilliamella sp. B3493]MCX8598351.1 dTDP-4-dehydrorhamnose reductase [Gilliamella sp. B3486]MCX8688498.1 dTDP-4-dehydrorhamnose reductase [Gilliamella sp. B2973]MCX8704338.1 dTDP-4-dehydrorhamnose reductase [Gilliamella sp. B3127]
MKVLLTGANGQLGNCFVDIFPSKWELIKTDAEQLDITDKYAVDRFIAKYKPDAIINAAAYTAVDKAEDEPQLAYNVNVIGPKNLSISSRKYNAKFFHVSTDYVFDGTNNIPYIEEDITNPINIYGETKRKGEIAVLDNDPSAIVIRTSWVFSPYGNNFVKTMLRLATEKQQLSIIDDQLGNPTYAGDLAQLILQLLDKKMDGGIYHFCGDSSTSWFMFAKKIFEIASNQKIITQFPEIIPVKTEAFPTKATRPKYSVMSVEKLGKYGLSASDWNKGLIHTISKIHFDN